MIARCVCVCAYTVCVCACVFACLRVCVCACELDLHASLRVCTLELNSMLLCARARFSTNVACVWMHVSR
jgi:hypothetical protein